MFDLDAFEDSIINEDNTGILLVDKPRGKTSHDMVAQARRMTGISRIGHTGTLDPLATGLLILLIGRQYTKLQTQFLKLDKEYLCVAELGRTTDSFDDDGVTQAEADWERLSKLTKEDVMKAVKSFKGTHDQTVPSFSAVKVDGKKMYELARKQRQLNARASGVDEEELLIDPDELPVREVTVFSIRLESFTKDTKNKKVFFSFRAFVSSGTYIRSLAYDIGQRLGVGATVMELRRTKIAHISVEKAQTLREKRKKPSFRL